MQSRRRPVFGPLLALLALSAIVACDDSTSLDREDVAGTYDLVFLQSSDDSEDLIEAGVEAELVLELDGTTSGSFFVPAGVGDPDEGDETYDLEGTWDVSGDRVTFDHESDTFIRDIAWEYEDDRLVAQTTTLTAVFERR